MSGRGHSLSQQIINEIKAAYALFVKQLSCRSVSTHIETSTFATSLSFQPGNSCITTLSSPQTRPIRPPSQEEVAIIPLIEHRRLLAYQNSLLCHAIQASFPTNSSQNLALQEHTASAKIVAVTWHRSGKISTQTIPTTSLQFKRHVQALNTHCSIKNKGSHTLAILSKKIRQTKATGLAQRIPWQKAPTPIHRFSPSLQKRFTEALAQQAHKPLEDILLKKVYARVVLDLFQRLGQDSKGNLICYPKPDRIKPTSARTYLKENPTSADTLNSQSELTCYLIFGTCLSNGETVRAKLFLSDKELSQ